MNTCNQCGKEMEREKIKEMLDNDDGFLSLEDQTAREWHNMCSYYLSQIADHEIELKHRVKLYGIRKKNYNTNREEYRKIWICDDCGYVFLKCKLDPELLEIKEFYQMCHDGGLSNLAREGFIDQVNSITSPNPIYRSN